MKKCYLCITSAAVGVLLAFSYVSHANGLEFRHWMTSEDVMIQLYLGKVALIPYVFGMAFIGWIAASHGWKNAVGATLLSFFFFLFAGALKSGGVPAVPPLPEIYALLAVLTIGICEAARRLYKSPAMPESAKPDNA